MAIRLIPAITPMYPKTVDVIRTARSSIACPFDNTTLHQLLAVSPYTL